MIKDKKLDKNVKLWGFKKFEFIKKYYQESSLYVMTSFEESFGLVLIEAMSFGVPCITFDSAKGALDLVDKNTGFVVKGRDKKKMVNKIVQYLEMTQTQRKAIGKNARLKAENYKLENIKKQWLDFLGYNFKINNGLIIRYKKDTIKRIDKKLTNLFIYDINRLYKVFPSYKGYLSFSNTVKRSIYL